MLPPSEATRCHLIWEDFIGQLYCQAPQGTTSSPKGRYSALQDQTLLPHQSFGGLSLPILTLLPPEGHLCSPPDDQLQVLTLKQTLQDWILWHILGAQNRESSLKRNVASLNLPETRRTPPGPKCSPLILSCPSQRSGGLLSLLLQSPKGFHFICSFPHDHPANGELLS